jgi:hypothetical protein
MTPPSSFVKDLRAYDPLLRVRWGRHTQMWVIERKMREQNPQYVAERPAEWSRSARRRDLWEGWREGHVNVMFVHRDLLGTPVFEALAECDTYRHGGFERYAAKLDAADEAWERSKDRDIQTYTEAAAYDFHDSLAWREGRKIQVPGEPVPPKDDVIPARRPARDPSLVSPCETTDGSRRVDDQADRLPGARQREGYVVRDRRHHDA